MLIVGPILARSFGPSLVELSLKLECTPLIINLTMAMGLPTLPLPLILKHSILVPEGTLSMLEAPPPIAIIGASIDDLVPAVSLSLILLVDLSVVLAATLHRYLHHHLVLILTFAQFFLTWRV